MAGSISPNEVNFRIQALQIDELLGGGTKCGQAPSGLSSSNGGAYSSHY